MRAPAAVIILAVATVIAPIPSRAEENEQEAITVGIGFAPTTTSSSSSSSDSVVSSYEYQLVEALERDKQVTVRGDVQQVELLCNSFSEADNATLLAFAISADEALIAEKTSYDVLDRDFFSDGVIRKVWNGMEVDTIEGAQRTVSMTWGEECDVEMFLLKITTNYEDGTLFVLKSVPCEMDSGIETCIVEVELDLQPAESEATTTIGRQSSDSDSQSRSADSSGSTPRTTTKTTIDVMMLYTETAKITLGGVSHSHVASTLAAAIVSSNEALENSKIDAKFRLVYTGPLPYDEARNAGMENVLNDFRDNDAVADLRTCAGADLVQLIVGEFIDYCGIGYLFNGDSEEGYSVASVNCIEGLVHTHEIGHNLGCDHNREDATTATQYAYGWRYCDGENPYRTIMSYRNNCNVGVKNYFSNPGVELYNKPTGQKDADNARAIELNMVRLMRGRCQPILTAKCLAQTENFIQRAVTREDGLVDASESTEVTVSANACDPRKSKESGCDPDGCVPGKTRDSILDDNSRWSRIYTLENETCRLSFTFVDAQDLVEINIAFYKGIERQRTFKVETWDTSGNKQTSEFTSSGKTNGFETFSLGSDETTELVIFPVSPNEDDWLSILEVEVMVR